MYKSGNPPTLFWALVCQNVGALKIGEMKYSDQKNGIGRFAFLLGHNVKPGHRRLHVDIYM